MTLTADPVVGAARVVVLSHDARDVRGSLAEFLHFGLSVVIRDDIVAALKEVVREPTTILVVACDIPCRTLSDVLDLAVATCGSAVFLGLHPAADSRVIARAIEAGVHGTIGLPLTGERLAEAIGSLTFESRARDTVAAGPLVIDPEFYEVRWQGAHIDTTPREFAALLSLARAYPQMATLTDLAKEYGPVADPFASVRVIINRIRTRIASVAGEDRVVIETIRGVGYRLTP